MQELGIHTNAARLGALTQQTLHHFVVALVDRTEHAMVQEQSIEVFWDLSFLLLLVGTWDPDMKETQSLLLGSLSRWTDQVRMCLMIRTRKVFANDAFPQGLPPHVRDGLTDWMSRLQVLLGIILPSRPSVSAGEGKTSSLLHLGPPTVDAQYQQAFELVKPSVRFGLLLVGSSVAR